MDICFNALLERVLRTLPELDCETPVIFRCWDEEGSEEYTDYLLRKAEVGYMGFFTIYYSLFKSLGPNSMIRWDLHPECGSRTVKGTYIRRVNGVRSIVIEMSEDYPSNSGFWVENLPSQPSSNNGTIFYFKNPFQ